MTEYQKPFLKWVGGKSKLLNKIVPNIPLKINNYHEVFLGGGSMLLAILTLKKEGKLIIEGKISAYDLNKSLINCFEWVRNSPLLVTEGVLKLRKEFMSIETNTLKQRGAPDINENNYKTTREHYYYYIRNKFNNCDKRTMNAAIYFIFLNKTGFRGMYREDKSGRFNIPYGLKDKKTIPGIINKEEILAISSLIEDVNFMNLDFEKTLDRVEGGDFVYLDPPYAPESNTSFVEYTGDGFNGEKHNILFEKVKKLKDVKWVMSNSNVGLVRDSFNGYNINEIVARRAINSKNPGATAKEVVIFN